MQVIHNTPPNDISSHFTRDCPCKPRAEVFHGLKIYWHKPFLGVLWIAAIELHLGMRCGNCYQYIDRETGAHIPDPVPMHEV